jgi:hypothetical protein
MIELRHDNLQFSFPDIHPDAKLQIQFQRTFRIPDDGKDYPLPPGFGDFPLEHVDDFAEKVPGSWLRHGGVMLPMYQSEALWIAFHGSYPFAVKIAAGKINAVTGNQWKNKLHREPQDYVVIPEQPWLDGFCFEEGFIRQVVAMPLGSGYSVEEQMTGSAEFGGLQLIACPMTRRAYEEYKDRHTRHQDVFPEDVLMSCCASALEMGLAPGGRMRQQIYDDPHSFDVWDKKTSGRCFVHIANSLIWRQITGNQPPTAPPTARMYNDAGLPWFEYYNESLRSLKGGK